MAPTTAFFLFTLAAFSCLGLSVFALAWLAPWEERLTKAQLQATMPAIHESVKLRDPGPVAIGATVPGSGDPVDLFTFTAPATTLLVELNGPSSVTASIWTGLEPVKGNGLAKGCGNNTWIRHTWKSGGPCCIQVTNPTGGPYTLTLAKWTVADNIYMNPFWNSHKSTC
jgi:hypothetical protein